MEFRLGLLFCKQGTQTGCFTFQSGLLKWKGWMEMEGLKWKDDDCLTGCTHPLPKHHCSHSRDVPGW